MRAIPSSEQVMLRDTAQKLATKMAIVTPVEIDAFDRAGGWASLAEAGLTGMRLREDGQPLATGYEAALVIEALAGQLCPLPLLGHLLAQELIGLAGLVPDDGVVCGLALTRDLTRPAVPGDTEAIVFDGAGANALIWLAADGAVHRSALKGGDAGAGVGVDLTRPFLALDGAVTQVLGRPLSAKDQARWSAFALSMICADMVGVMRIGLAQAVEYATMRVQYDQPIGRFQAVQHMCADILVQTEAAASAAQYAAWAVDVLDPADSLLAARTAKAFCASAGRTVGETLMQVYGGIGQTWEHIAHLRARRLMVDAKLLGDEADQLLHIADVRMGAA